MIIPDRMHKIIIYEQRKVKIYESVMKWVKWNNNNNDNKGKECKVNGSIREKKNHLIMQMIKVIQCIQHFSKND